jgi:hypothetical protein
MLVACVLLLVVFAGIGRHVLAMTVGTEPPAPPGAGREPLLRQLPVLLALGAAAVLGFVAPLAGVLGDAVAALGGLR